jgi:hypothetical protein
VNKKIVDYFTTLTRYEPPIRNLLKHKSCAPRKCNFHIPVIRIENLCLEICLILLSFAWLVLINICVVASENTGIDYHEAVSVGFTVGFGSGSRFNKLANSDSIF